jgi:hypothetical protein
MISHPFVSGFLLHMTLLFICLFDLEAFFDLEIDGGKCVDSHKELASEDSDPSIDSTPKAETIEPPKEQLKRKGGRKPVLRCSVLPCLVHYC